MVNSSLFGLSREVSDLNQALALLGIKPLKLLVLGFSLPSGLFLDVESKTLLWYWKHTLTKAVAGRELSHRLWRIPGDEAFLAGLFQDLGVLLLFQQLGQPYARFLDRAVSHGLDLCASNSGQWASRTRSCRPGCYGSGTFRNRCARPWPGSLRRAKRRPALAQILHLGELFARLFADGQTAALAELLETGRRYCHLLDRQLEPLVSGNRAESQRVGRYFLARPARRAGISRRAGRGPAAMAQVTTQAAEDLLRNRVPENGGGDEDWLLDDFDWLTDALNEVCVTPVARVPAVAKAETGAGATAVAVVPPMVAAAPATAAKARPAADGAAPNLLDRLTGYVTVCRPARCPLSLLLVKLSAAEELLTACRPQEIAMMRQVCWQRSAPTSTIPGASACRIRSSGLP